MFSDNFGKKNFLRKMEEEKKKAKGENANKKVILKLQKCIKAYLSRRYLSHTRNIKLSLFLGQPLDKYLPQQISACLSNLNNSSDKVASIYHERIIGLSFEQAQIIPFVISTLIKYRDSKWKVIDKKAFIQKFINVLSCENQDTTDQYFQYASLILEAYFRAQKLHNIPSDLINARILRMCNKTDINFQTITCLIEYLRFINYSIHDQFTSFVSKISRLINNNIPSVCVAYLIDCLFLSGFSTYNSLLEEASKEYNHLQKMIEDQEDLFYCQSLIKQNEHLQTFTREFLNTIRKMFLQPIIMKTSCTEIQRIVFKYIEELRFKFQDKQLIFLNQILRAQWCLNCKQNDFYYEVIKFKLLSLDDSQFKSTEIFTIEKWGQFIDQAIKKAFQLVKKNIIQRKEEKKSLKLFVRKNLTQNKLQTIFQLLNDLYQKALRTKKIPLCFFQKQTFSNSLIKFLFGIGAQAIETMLAKAPFVFNFESRLQKFKQFIKLDKKNYDRTLFLHEQIDQNLIIFVRRGKQFLDAFQQCMNRDLRRKYKIIFFNEQGIEEEGIDGGGIIKQFINRVLGSAFSETYGMFYDTPLNEIMPNPISKIEKEYQLVGKLIGKAVYQGIIIQQKFAQPFLNLVIGKQNGFEDLQFIDPQVYKSLVHIRHMQDVSVLQQSFTIRDLLPNGKIQYIDLLNPWKLPSKHVLLTNQNKDEFVRRYADWKCNKQINSKTRAFKKGFTKVIQTKWLTLFNNQQLNRIISGGEIDFPVQSLKFNCVLIDYHQKDITIIALWQLLGEMSPNDKAAFLLFVTSCSRPPTLGFGTLKPLLGIAKVNDCTRLPTANTCMNILRLPDYKNKEVLKNKLYLAIHSKAGFQLG